MGDSSTLNWTNLGTITPAAGWLSTAPTDANVFKLEHHNPPPHTLLQVAQTDGLLWLFEPLVVSSDTTSQVLVLPNSPIFGGQRRISLRYANPASRVSNWTVTVSAATVDLNASLEAISTTLAQVQSVLGTVLDREAQIIQGLATLQSAIANSSNTGGTTGGSTGGTTGAQSAGSVAYTLAMSGTYNGVQNTVAALTDGNGATGAQTAGELPSFIRAVFPNPVIVTTVTVGGGTIPATGYISPTLNNAKLQYSQDGTSWTDVWTVSGVTDSGGNQFATYTLPSPVTAKYWQLTGPQYLGTTEFRFS